MNIKYKNAFICFLLRPWLGVPLAVWLAVSILYYCWLISKISLLEGQNKMIKTLSEYTLQRIGINSETTILPNISHRNSLCETVHIAVICMGTCSRHITSMLKSLLHHRQNPIHFHLAVDDANSKIMSTLLDTWNLPDVAYTCYNMEKELDKVSTIPNTHYSGVYSFVKLLFPEVMPKTLSRIIVLDTDLTFLCDIAELWGLFRNMSDEQFIGLVENESTWYYEAARWPALGMGYNTGVMLLDLEKVRTTTNWTALWRDVTEENLRSLKKTALADQDIINAVIKKHPSFVYNISCQFNVQMSTKSLAKFCYGDDKKKIKIIHWNSPYKHNVSIKDANYFRSIHQSYVNYDGNLLREKLYKCTEADSYADKINVTDVCKSFRAAQQVNLRTHLYYAEYGNSALDMFDVTLVMQLSMDRLQFLERLIRQWDGPMSAAVYMNDCDSERFMSFISEPTISRANIAYHVVYRTDSVHYPVNYLRNVALENIRTPYAFLMDVDFVPMSGLYRHLRDAIRLINPYPQKKCLVVAAFETQMYRAHPPRTKRALIARIKKNATSDVAPFRLREWPSGHRATNYTRWMTASAPYEVEWQPDYEPYLVVHRSIPKYDIRFSGFGWNKVSHSVLLRAHGYRPVVLPDAFVVHTPHAPSPDITAFRAHLHYRLCLAILKQEYMEDLKKQYNITFEEQPKQDFYSLKSKKINSL